MVLCILPSFGISTVTPPLTFLASMPDGAFDSSPLVVPMGNDLLVLALSARYHDRVLYYVVMATVGSLIGCFATDWISRKSEGGQKKFLSGKHLDYFRKLVEKQAMRRVDGGSLTDEEIERLGETLMKLEMKMDELKKHFNLTDRDLNINLGPLGDLM